MSNIFLAIYRSVPEGGKDYFSSRIEKLNKSIKPAVPVLINDQVSISDKSVLSVTSVHPGILIEGMNVCCGVTQAIRNDWWKSSDMPPSASFMLNVNDEDCVMSANLVASRSVWYYYNEVCLLISTSQRAIVSWLGSYESNGQAISWMLATGNLGPGFSWDKRIKHLGAGETLKLQRHDWKFTSYFRKIHLPSRDLQLTENESIDKLKLKLEEVFSKMKIPLSSTVLSLSGGYDSRAVLYYLVKNGYPIDTVTWGLSSAIQEYNSDAFIAKRIAESLDVKHSYYPTDFSEPTFEGVFDKYIRAGEGRLDHLNAFMDGFRMWQSLFILGYRNSVRADEVFGWLPCQTDQDVRVSLDFHLMQDNANMPHLEHLGLEPQVYPMRFSRNEDESRETWRDRLYREFRIPYVLTGLHDLIHPYFEMINPFLHEDIITYAAELPDKYRTGKKLYTKLVDQFYPEIPLARKASIPEPSAILRSSIIVEFIRDELGSSRSRNILGSSFVNSVENKLEINDRRVNKTNQSWQLWLKAQVPWKIKKIIRRDFIKYHGDYNQLAFRALIVKRMHDLLIEDSQVLLKQREAVTLIPEKGTAPFFTIIIPTYNRAHMLQKTIESVQSQRFRNFEAIIVDDGSTDNTSDIIPNLIDGNFIYHKTENRERGATRNTGMQLAKGDYVCFLDSDDFLLPNHLQYAHEIIEKNPGIPVFHLNYEFRNPENMLRQKIRQLPPVINDLLIQANVISCNGVFIRKDLCTQFQFSENRELSGTEDYELWLRIASTMPIRHFPMVTSIIVDHEGRSMADPDSAKMMKRISVFTNLVSENKKVRSFIGNRFKEFEAYCYSYISLSLALAGRSIQAISFMIKAFFKYPASIFERRTLATIKYIFYNLFRKAKG